MLPFAELGHQKRRRYLRPATRGQKPPGKGSEQGTWVLLLRNHGAATVRRCAQETPAAGSLCLRCGPGVGLYTPVLRDDSVFADITLTPEMVQPNMFLGHRHLDSSGWCDGGHPPVETQAFRYLPLISCKAICLARAPASVYPSEMALACLAHEAGGARRPRVPL